MHNESFLSQKSKAIWLKEGDSNIKIFPSIINWKRRKNLIKGLEEEGVWEEDPLKVKEEVRRYFERFLEEGRDRPILDGVQFQQKNLWRTITCLFWRSFAADSTLL